MKRFFLIFFVSISIFIFTLYACFLFVLPEIISNKKAISKLEKTIFDNTKIKFNIDNPKFKPNYNLSFKIKTNNIEATKDGRKILGAKNLSFEFNAFKYIPKKIYIDSLYFDKTNLPEFKKKTKKKSNLDFNIIKDVYIQKAEIILQNDTKNKFKIYMDNTRFQNFGNKQLISFNALIKNNKLKHDIILNSQDDLYIEDNKLFAKNFRVETDKKALVLNGKLFDSEKKYDFKVKGNNFCVNAIEEAFLTFIKKKNPNKNFIENFYDFDGLANVDLNVSNSSLNGNILIKNLKAKTVKFSIPLYFKTANFVFLKDKITLKTKGTLGGENAYTDLYVTDLFTDKKIKGSVKSSITKEFVNKYLPNYRLEGAIKANVDYFVYNKKITVEYLMQLPKGTNIGFKNSNLSLTDKNRRIYAKTYKSGDKLYLKNYDYSFIENNKIKNIVLGEGLYKRINDHLVMDYITCKTDSWAPISIIGSINNFVLDGEFSGSVKYSGKNNSLEGSFLLRDSSYKDFEIEDAKVVVNKEKIVANANGFYEDEPYNCLIDISNRSDKIVVNTLRLYLKKYIIKQVKRKKECKTKKKIDILSNIQKTQCIIKNGYIKLDELKYENIILNNVELYGTAKNNIINFKMPAIRFADGILSAKGMYDIIKHNSDIYFSADKINSNLAASMIFNLKDQIEGYANATCHLVTLNKLSKIRAHSTFSIHEGALVKIGSTNFMIKKNEKIKKDLKFTISDITNIDIKKMEALKSNIKGSFDVDNSSVKNVEMFAKHKYLALFVEGNYKIKKQDANINVWGAYNKDSQKGIKILFIPLSVITKVIFWHEESKKLYCDKINKIPEISADNSQKEIFRVKMRGNLNNNKSIKVMFKKLK